MPDKMLELYSHGQITEFVIDETNIPEEHYEAFDAHLAVCEICGPIYRTGWGVNDSEPCNLDTYKRFLSLLVPAIRKRNLFTVTLRKPRASDKEKVQ